MYSPHVGIYVGRDWNTLRAGNEVALAGLLE